jgi:hypothetical protein
MVAPINELTEGGLALVAAADEAGVPARLLGGVAIALHCPSAALESYNRIVEDIDAVVEKGARRQLDSVAAACGFAPDVEFNNLHGRERRIYYSERYGKLDIFVGMFDMCHAISFEGRLELDHPTIALVDLFLTKAQIVQLNRKDVLDLLVLLADHPVGSGDDETINADYVAELCARDWGIWRTVTGTLDSITAAARHEQGIGEQREAILNGVENLRAAIDEAPKSGKWRLRAKVGERRVWYALPEETGDAAHA